MICAWIDTSSAVVGSSAISELGLGGQRERDHDALAHAARELVRVVVDAALGRRNAGGREQFDGPRPRPGRRHVQVGRDRLDQLLPTV